MKITTENKLIFPEEHKGNVYIDGLYVGKATWTEDEVIDLNKSKTITQSFTIGWKGELPPDIIKLFFPDSH